MKYIECKIQRTSGTDAQIKFKEVSVVLGGLTTIYNKRYNL